MVITETTIGIRFSTRDDFKQICSEEGRTYDGQLRYWIKEYKKKNKKKEVKKNEKK